MFNTLENVRGTCLYSDKLIKTKYQSVFAHFLAFLFKIIIFGTSKISDLFCKIDQCPCCVQMDLAISELCECSHHSKAHEPHCRLVYEHEIQPQFAEAL